MNSLQLVSALLTLQGRSLGQSEGADQLKMAARRVSAVARVHQHIYLSEGVESADCKEYLKRLCSDLSGVLRSEGDSEIEVKSIDASIPTERIVPIGLIVNELVTNAAKHGGGRITVAFERASAGYALSVSDGGAGLPEDFDPASTSGLGMKVVSALVQQLGGNLVLGTAERQQGATFTVLFPETNRPRLN
jgi:two-component sensor histidine kinase